MEKDLLLSAGLTDDESTVYRYLLAQGGSTAGQIIKGVGLKRGHVYNILKSLVLKNLVEQSERGKVAFFQLDHPTRLYQHVQERVQGMQQAARALKEVFPDLVSEFNLSHHKPGVYYYEGPQGAQHIADDSLTAKGEILSYIDNEAVNKYMADANRDYVQKRRALGIKKRMITVDGPYIREHVQSMDPELTEVRVIEGAAPFATVMQMYNAKVSYLTLSDERLLGVIIEDGAISSMHRALFEHAWQSAKKL